MINVALLGMRNPSSRVVPERGLETVIDALTAAAAMLPMPWSAIVAGALGLAGTIWAWKKRGNKKGK